MRCAGGWDGAALDFPLDFQFVVRHGGDGMRKNIPDGKLVGFLYDTGQCGDAASWWLGSTGINVGVESRVAHVNAFLTHPLDRYSVQLVVQPILCSRLGVDWRRDERTMQTCVSRHRRR